MSSGEVKPQSAMTPRTSAGSGRPQAIITLLAPIEMPSSTIGRPGRRALSSRAQAATSRRSSTPSPMRAPSLRP